MKKLTKEENKEVEQMISHYDSLDKRDYEMALYKGIIKLKIIHDKLFANCENSEVKEK